jgi:hypothetical protein
MVEAWKENTNFVKFFVRIRNDVLAVQTAFCCAMLSNDV